jgi:glycerol-3-phosphate dehydrogenase
MKTLTATTHPIANLRQTSAARLNSLSTPDVLIVGGGVNGVATLRDLSLNGVSCVLIDTGDFCGGASSASSRMAHGGLRYLEGREFRLVSESARERNRLIAYAGHLVKPLEIVVPLDHFVGGFGRSILRFLGLSTRAGPLSLAALDGALRLYEAFGRREHPLPSHKILLRREKFPTGLRPETRAVATYFDGQITQPEGLVFEMLSEALDQGAGVAALNHMIWHKDGATIVAKDRFNGQEYHITPKIVINAAGAWIDVVNGELGGHTEYLRCVKGAHLVIDNPALYQRMAGRAFYFDDGAGRMIITLPVGDNILVGTTEIETTDANDRQISEQEVGYLLRAIDGLFTDITVERAQIVSMTTGIRPLRRGGGSANSAARDHALEEDRFEACSAAVLSLVGGKWTTFRAFGEEAANRALDLLGRDRKISTADRIYPGAGPCAHEELPASDDISKRLVARYGAVAREVAPFCTGAGGAPLADASGYCRGEIVWAIHARAACCIEDLVLRRTDLSHGKGLSLKTVQDLAVLLTQEAGRDPKELAAEIAAVQCDPRLMGGRVVSDGDAA